MKKTTLRITLACIFALIVVLSASVISFAAENAAQYENASGEIVYEASLEDAVMNAPAGATITLLKDVSLEKGSSKDNRYCLAIEKNMTIDGQGKYTITCGTQRGIGIWGAAAKEDIVSVEFRNVKIQNSINMGRVIDTRGGYLSLTLNNSTLETTGVGNNQSLTIGGNHAELTDVVIKDSTITSTTAGYAVVTFNPVNMTIDNSELFGYAAVYMKGKDSSAGSAGSKVLIKNGSVIRSENPHPEGQNGFATIVMEDGDTKIEILDSTVKAGASKESGQNIISINPLKGTYPQNVEMIISGSSKIQLDGEKTSFVKDWQDEKPEENPEGIKPNNIIIQSAEMNFPAEEKYIAPNKIEIKYTEGNTDRFIVGSQQQINDILADAKEGSKVTVLAGDAEIEIPAKGVEVFNKGDGKVTVNGVTVEKDSEKPVITEGPKEPVTPPGEGSGEGETEQGQSPQTGDSSNVNIFIALLLISAAAGITTLRFKRKAAR